MKNDDTLGILLANVLITNRQSAALLTIVRDRDPDMLLVMEVDDWWMEQLIPLDTPYPYTVKQPNDGRLRYGAVLQVPPERHRD